MALAARLPRELAQVLPVGRRKLLHQFGQRVVAVVDEAVAPLLEAMQLGGFAPGELAVVVELRAQRRQFILVPAHDLGEVLDLALARDLLRDAACLLDFVEQVFGQRQLAELGVGERNEALGQFEYGQRVAAPLAAARAVVVIFGNFVVVFAHGVVQCRQRRKG